MSLGGHRLSERRTRTLGRKAGLDLDVAFYPGGRWAHGIAIQGTTCQHYDIDVKAGTWEQGNELHFTFCPIYSDPVEELK